MNQSTIDVGDLAEIRQLTFSGEAASIRKQARLRRSEVARHLGVTDAAVARWEAGDRMPTGRKAIQYLDVLRRLRAVSNTAG